MNRPNRYGVTDRRRAAFEQQEGEDPYQWIARQLTMAKPFEVAWLMLVRSDEKQLRALEMMQQAKTVYWTRLAVIFAALSLPISALAILLSSG